MSAFTPTFSRVGRVLVTTGAVAALVFGTALSASAVIPRAGDPVNTAAPAITGTPNVGQVLTASEGTWNNRNVDGDNNQTEYRWFEGENTLQNGVSHSYPLTSNDRGKTIAVAVTVFSGSTASAPAQSAGVTIVSSVVATTSPTITGGTTVGDTLTITPGVYTGGDVAETYQWFVNGVNEAGEPASGDNLDDVGTTHLLGNADIRMLVGVIVTATSGGNGDSVTTRLVTPTVVVPAAAFATDAGLTSANQGGVTGSVTATTATITLARTIADGTEVYVFGYSTPTPLGFYRVVGNQIVVNFAALPAGAHKLLVIGPDGTVLGWFGVSVLAATGANVNGLEFAVAGGMLASGVLLLAFFTRSRRRARSL